MKDAEKYKKSAYNNSYDDMLCLPHHVSSVHPHMSVYDRAAQFSPFAALTGHTAALRETERLTDEKIDLPEDAAYILNEKLQRLLSENENPPDVEITYFQPDQKKSGGSYQKIAGKIKKINLQQRTIVMQDGPAIPMEAITDIESDLFRNPEYL